jgi:MoxR-like ATPase
MTAHAHVRLGEASTPAATPLALALQALDARLVCEARRVGARGMLSLDELRGLYASAERIERLLASHAHDEPAPEAAWPDTGALSDPLLTEPAWRALARELAHTPIERDVVLLALARELRLDYEIIFGFLNDDLTRRWPTRDLALRLLARDDDERARVCAALGESAHLVRHGLLRICDSGDHASWLASGVCVAPLAAALLGNAGAPAMRLPPGVTVIAAPSEPEAAVIPKAAQARLARIVRAVLDDESLPLVVLEGRRGCGRMRLARDLARAIAAPLLRVDIGVAADAAPADASPRSRASGAAEAALSAALLWQRLARAVVLVDGADAWFAHGEAAAAPPHALIEQLGDARGPVLLRLENGARWHTALGTLRTTHVEVAEAGATERCRAWRDALSRATPRAKLADREALALGDRFDLTPGRIARIVRRAADEGALDDAAHAQPASSALVGRLSEAARDDSREAIGRLAVRAPTPHAWDDLVLPAPTLARLRDFSAAIRDRAIVLDRWGFGRRAVRARGVSALFAGASGTGKTMAASVIARELALDLFVVDLSTVVSKYIGETEKNLEKVFRAARDAGAILFFDEADALFGKRSEVKDAHDRYANIEVAYLLQQLDAHDGIVVLATNLSRNLDAAFSRRMRYVIEFPLPGQADRLRLWHGIFPAEAPLDTDVDLAFLAASFPLAGGDIRNVALEAAYLAAADGSDSRGTIAMRHLVRAMARQVSKEGRTPSAAEFRHFIALVDRDG